MLIPLKSILQTVFGLLLVSTSIFSQANASSKDMVVYIDPTFYQHHERLLHPYYNYWFSQGPTFESVALQALETQSSPVKLCQAGQLAKQVISLSPTMFYNPQLRVYYSTIKAHVYAGDGTLLGEYQGEGEQQGFQSVDVGLQGHMKGAYVAAMQDLMQKIRFDQDKTANSNVQLPCQIVGAQTKPSYFR